jgi:hypothetical protein
MKTRRYHIFVRCNASDKIVHEGFEYSGYAMADEILYLRHNQYPARDYTINYVFESE